MCVSQPELKARPPADGSEVLPLRLRPKIRLRYLGLAVDCSMIIIGIAGGVASGKSVVATHLAGLGAHLFDADAIGHSVLREPATVEAARARWGTDVLDESGEIRRSAIAALVFGDSPEAIAELEFWEKCTHPRISERVRSKMDRLRASGACRVVILDAPVMFKAGWDAMCDSILFVDTPWELRWERARKRGWTQKQFKDRESSQYSIEEKRRRSSFVIDNSGTLDETYIQVARFWNSLSL